MRATLNILGFMAVALLATSASGAITYVDAVANTTGADGNTTINGALVTGSNTGTTSSDDLWRIRAVTEAAGGALWESDTTTPAEGTSPLITSISLGPGAYNLYGVFRDQPGTESYWDAAFSLDGVNFTAFDYRHLKVKKALADGSEFTNPGIMGDIAAVGGAIYFADIGQVTLASPTLVSIYIQGPEQDLTGASPPQTGNTGQRTWYEGVGFELVPEPSGLTLTVCGLIGLVAARRRHSANL